MFSTGKKNKHLHVKVLKIWLKSSFQLAKCKYLGGLYLLIDNKIVKRINELLKDIKRMELCTTYEDGGLD